MSASVKMPDFTPEKWAKWLKDKEYAEDRVEHLEDELDKALDEQERLSHANEEMKVECDAEKRLRVQAESDARRAKAAADQAAAAAAAASRSLKLGEKQGSVVGKDGAETQELRTEIQQLKAKNHGLNTQMDALAVDHERLAGLLSTAEKDRDAAHKEAGEVRSLVASLEDQQEATSVEMQTREADLETLVAERDAAKLEAKRLEAQNTKLGDELDRLAVDSSGQQTSKGATKARQVAEERLAMSEAQVAALQTELESAREEVVTLQDAAEMKAGAMREGLAAADAQAAAATEEATALRKELATLKADKEENQGPSVVGEDDEITTMRTQLKESEVCRTEAQEKRAELESHLEVATKELSGVERRSAEWRDKAMLLEKQLEITSGGLDEEGTKNQLLEMMTLLKDAETSKEEALEKLEARTQEVEELRTNAPQTNGTRSFGDGGSGAGVDARVAALQEELDDLHAMLDNVVSERDTALNDLRRAGGGGAGDDDTAKDGDETTSKAAALATAQEELSTAREETEILRQDCDDLREKVMALQNEQDEGLNPDDKRVRILEDQVERLSQEHTRQSETWRGLSSQLESEKEELSQELISAKLQVAQLSMEVDGLKLRHRQETIATALEHAEALQHASSPTSSQVSTMSRSTTTTPTSNPPASPQSSDLSSSPQTLEL